MKTEELFLHFVQYGTQSDDSSDTVPSTAGQLTLGRELVRQMQEMGITDAHQDGFGYVYGTIPATPGVTAPVIGLIAHMDTATELPGDNVRPRVVPDYDGGDVVLNEAENIVLRPAQFPALKNYIGERLIVTDGTTLLGADDKAGLAEILTAAERLLNDEVPHGKVRIAFTPDEEIGRGADHFDVAGFGADFAYTVDGGPIGELECENFNAASASVVIRGENIHPGNAKGQMVNATLLAMEFNSMLPGNEIPATTEGYEGFFHLGGMQGDVERAELSYIIRDFDRDSFARRKVLMQQAAAYLNLKYGADRVQVTITDSYFNMKEMLLPHPEIMELANAAMQAAGVTPVIVPIRGGTDGARLSYMGLPCPNICTGGHNPHGRYEFTVSEEMEKVADVLVQLMRLAAERTDA
ncbi:MAG: peptidase T [Clostridia bacterium]|nr:peptidase T [Clostridia bacterium]